MTALAPPVGAPAYIGPSTWDDAGWRSCPACEVEWVGDTPCFLDARHAGRDGRLRSWCRHGLRRVPQGGERLCPACDRHDAWEFTPEFVDWLALAAGRALGDDP